MHNTYLEIQTIDDEKISVAKVDLILHLANYAVTKAVTDPGIQSLQRHTSYFSGFQDEMLVRLWDEKKYTYQGLLKSGKAAFNTSDDIFGDVEFDPTDLSKLRQMKPDYIITIENELGDKIEIERRHLEERIALRDADIQWSAINQALSEGPDASMPVDLISVFQEGYTPPSKMIEEVLLRNWEEVKEGFYRSCTEFDLGDYIAVDDPEWRRLSKLTSSPTLD